MRRTFIVAVVMALITLAGCALPTADQIYLHKPLKIEATVAPSLLDRAACVIAIHGETEAAITTYRDWIAQQSEGGVLWGWGEYARYGAVLAGGAAATVATCKYTLQGAQGIAYWCGVESHPLYDRNGQLVFEAEAVRAFFDSGLYRCDHNGYAYACPEHWTGAYFPPCLGD